MRPRYADRYFAPARKPSRFIRPIPAPPPTPKRGRHFRCGSCGTRLEVTAERVTDSTRFACCGQDMNPV
jgi:hypothetical protein